MKFEFPDEDIEVLKSKDCEEPIPEEGSDPESERILMSDGEVKVSKLLLPEQHLNAPTMVTESEACILGAEPQCVYLLGQTPISLGEPD